MNSSYLKGTCTEMCPEEEIIRRERDGLLHILEISPNSKHLKKPKANRNYVVKEFTRSAAGRNSQDVESLRTQDALLLTVGYLLHDVISNKEIPWNIVYDFIMDRLRAVRQDMVIQNMPRSFCISILQPISKFYVYSAYRLCDQQISIFDPYINNTHLQECLKRLLRMYDDLDILISKIPKRGDTINENILYSQCRPFMESLYLILNLESTAAMERALNLPVIWKNDLVKKCLNMSLDYLNGNYVKLCRHILTLPVLLMACAVLHLPKIRKKTLSIMSNAYCSKNINFPADVLEKLLLYNNIEELLQECNYYGIYTENNKITFNKTTFQINKVEPPPNHCKFVDKLLDKKPLPNLLLEESYENCT